jgi:hypothetical protein
MTRASLSGWFGVHLFAFAFAFALASCEAKGWRWRSGRHSRARRRAGRAAVSERGQRWQHFRRCA